MPNEIVANPLPVQPDYVCVATESLATMRSQHQALEASNRRLMLAIAASGHDLRQRLHMLLTTIDRLASIENEARRTELSERAKSLIFRLPGELEQLASRAHATLARLLDHRSASRLRLYLHSSKATGNPRRPVKVCSSTSSSRIIGWKATRIF
jgi:light-regulated signal transduction histidine kinase (bacteriophytochrome)